jgi:hypothetical protein
MDMFKRLISTRFRIAILVASWLMVAPLEATAISRDDPLFKHLTGYVSDVLQFNNQSLRYNADTNLLSYFASGLMNHDQRGCTAIACDPIYLQFDGLFVWSAQVNERGKVTNPGSMLWYGDFGSGLEVLASGHLRQVDASHLWFVNPEPFPSTELAQFSALFSLDFLDHRVAGMGNHIWFDFNHTFNFPGQQLASLFSTSFECSRRDPTSPCSVWSEPGLLGIRVPEPSMMALFAFSLCLLPFALRRKLS